MGWTFNFFNAPCSFLSSCAVAALVLGTIFRRTVPLPPVHQKIWASKVPCISFQLQLTNPVAWVLRLQLGELFCVHGGMKWWCSSSLLGVLSSSTFWAYVRDRGIVIRFTVWRKSHDLWQAYQMKLYSSFLGSDVTQVRCAFYLNLYYLSFSSALSSYLGRRAW